MNSSVRTDHELKSCLLGALEVHVRVAVPVPRHAYMPRENDRLIDVTLQMGEITGRQAGRQLNLFPAYLRPRLFNFFP